MAEGGVQPEACGDLTPVFWALARRAGGTGRSLISSFGAANRPQPAPPTRLGRKQQEHLKDLQSLYCKPRSRDGRRGMGYGRFADPEGMMGAWPISRPPSRRTKWPSSTSATP